MIQFENLPGFEYGHPPEYQTPWYGLWTPVLDCFVYVSFDLELIRKIQLLTTNKIPLTIVKLSADLYKSNTIDNTCCENWTIDDLETVDFHDFYPLNYFPLCQQIKTATCTDPNIISFKLWIIFLTKWIRKIQKIDHHYKHFVFEIFDVDDGRRATIKKIYQLLLFGEDVDEVEVAINYLVNDLEV